MARNLGLVIALASHWLVRASEADAAVVSAAFLAPVGWWPKAPSSETTWNIVAMLFTALIAAVAAVFAARWAASATMKNARELQDRERRLEEKSVAALLSADLHRKLILLVHLLQGPEADRLRELATMNIAMSSKALEAALPKLGDLGHQGAANMFAAFDGIAQLVSDARGEGRARQGLTERMQCVALHVGHAVNTLWRRYELDRPEPLEKAGMDLEEVGLRQLKDLGL